MATEAHSNANRHTERLSISRIQDTRYEIQDTRYHPSILFNHFTIIMQNKPNLLNTQMNVNNVLPRDYENARPFRHRENKPKQTQFKANLLYTQMNVNSVLLRNYGNVRSFSCRENKPNQTQFQSQTNPKITNLPQIGVLNFCIFVFLNAFFAEHFFRLAFFCQL